MKNENWKSLAFFLMGVTIVLACNNLATKLADPEVSRPGGEGSGWKRILTPAAYAAENGGYLGHANWRCSLVNKRHSFKMNSGTGNLADNATALAISEDKLSEFRCIPGSVVYIGHGTAGVGGGVINNNLSTFGGHYPGFCCASMASVSATIENPAQ